MFSDVATISSNSVIDLSGGGFLFIVARFLSAWGDCRLDIKVGTTGADVCLYVDELQQNGWLPLTTAGIWGHGSLIVLSLQDDYL